MSPAKPAFVRQTDGLAAVGSFELESINRRLRGEAPEAILRWAVEAFRGRICLQSSMQRRSSVLIHMLAAGGFHEVPALFVDTGFHFAETLETRDRLAETYGIEVITVYPDMTPEAQAEHFGCDLWSRPETYKLCCELRKERPFLRAASRFDAVISGLQPSDGGARSAVSVVDWDPRIDAWVVHPLAVWSSLDVNAYLDRHDVLTHPLHDQGFPSVGCATCTTAVHPGEDDRAGRWRHIREALEREGEAIGSLYCNINWVDRAGT